MLQGIGYVVDLDGLVVTVDGLQFEVFLAEFGEDLRREFAVSPAADARCAVGARQTDGRAVLAEVTVLEVNDRLADQVVRADHVEVHDADVQVLGDRDARLQLEHSTRQHHYSHVASTRC